MVTVNATRTYLRTVIGLGNNAEGTERADAIMSEGLNDLADIHELANDDGIKTLCASVRKPAGTIAQPGWVAPVPNPNQLAAPQVPRAGKVIPAICEQRMMMAAYGATIYESIGREITPASLSRARLKQFKLHKAMVDNHNEPEALPDIGKSYSTMKYLDQLPTYLSEVIGVNKVPLAYVIRDEVTPTNPLPPLIDNVPGITTAKPWSEQHEGLMEELIAFLPHNGPGYIADNAQLFNLLATHLGNTSAMASITQYQRRRDGRGAYRDLVTHYMGSAKWEKTVEQAESVLSTRIWNGKNSRYPLRVHISRHREAFNDLTRAAQQITYVPPNETSRVRYLLNSIQSSDPTICSGKTTILADAAKKDNFELAADFLMTICPPPKSQNNTHRIAAIRQQRGKKGKVKIGPKTGVEIRFYRKDEWSRLSREQQNEVRDARRQELKRKADDKAGSKESNASKIAALETRLEEQMQKIAALKSTNDKLDDKREVPLPPKPCGNPLKPPTGFTQRGS